MVNYFRIIPSIIIVIFVDKYLFVYSFLSGLRSSSFSLPLLSEYIISLFTFLFSPLPTSSFPLLFYFTLFPFLLPFHLISFRYFSFLFLLIPSPLPLHPSPSSSLSENNILFFFIPPLSLPLSPFHLPPYYPSIFPILSILLHFPTLLLYFFLATLLPHHLPLLRFREMHFILCECLY